MSRGLLLPEYKGRQTYRETDRNSLTVWQMATDRLMDRVTVQLAVVSLWVFCTGKHLGTNCIRTCTCTCSLQWKISHQEHYVYTGITLYTHKQVHRFPILQSSMLYHVPCTCTTYIIHNHLLPTCVLQEKAAMERSGWVTGVEKKWPSKYSLLRYCTHIYVYMYQLIHFRAVCGWGRLQH